MRLRGALGAIAAVALATGCATVRGPIKEMFQQPPSSLGADTATAGLVVLDFSIRPPRGLPLSVQGAHIRATISGAPDVYSARFEVGNEPFGVLFRGVPPGRYRVTSVLASEMVYDAGVKRQTPHLRGWSVEDSTLEFDVHAGALSYVGCFVAETHGRRASPVWYPTPTRERSVWRAVGRKYSPSPWDDVIQARIAAIEHASGEPSPSAPGDTLAGDARLGSTRPLDYPDQPKRFERIVMAEKVSAYARRAGPTGFRGTLIVRRDSVIYLGTKSSLALAAGDLRAVHRQGYWVEVEYDRAGTVRRTWFGFGFHNDSEITDSIERSIASLVSRHEESR
jgi:hypothetical protein